MSECLHHQVNVCSWNFHNWWHDIWKWQIYWPSLGSERMRKHEHRTPRDRKNVESIYESELYRTSSKMFLNSIQQSAVPVLMYCNRLVPRLNITLTCIVSRSPSMGNIRIHTQRVRVDFFSLLFFFFVFSVYVCVCVYWLWLCMRLGRVSRCVVCSTLFLKNENGNTADWLHFTCRINAPLFTFMLTL